MEPILELGQRLALEAGRTTQPSQPEALLLLQAPAVGSRGRTSRPLALSAAADSDSTSGILDPNSTALGLERWGLEAQT